MIPGHHRGPPQEHFLPSISCSKELFQLYTSKDGDVRHRHHRFENKAENNNIKGVRNITYLRKNDTRDSFTGSAASRKEV